MKTFTIDKLLEWGYNEYSYHLDKTEGKRYFQKTIRNSDDDKLYFINVEYWSWDNFPQELKNNPKYEFSSEVHFFLEDEHGFTVKYDIDSEKTLVGEMEEFYERIYDVMCCIPDIHNN